MGTAPLFLAKHVYACQTDEHIVFLDLRQDKYLCLGREQSRAMQPMLAETGDFSGIGDHSTLRQRIDRTLQALLNKGLLVYENAAGKNVVFVSTDQPEKGMPDRGLAPPATVTFRDVMNFFNAAFVASMRLRLCPIESTVRRVEHRRRSASSSVADRCRPVDEHTAAFHALRAYYPREYLCLFDSLALIEFLARYNLFPHWVFAVKMEPFSAHCWVQDGSTILNDTVEYVREFTPIMAV